MPLDKTEITVLQGVLLALRVRLLAEPDTRAAIVRECDQYLRRQLPADLRRSFQELHQQAQ